MHSSRWLFLPCLIVGLAGNVGCSKKEKDSSSSESPRELTTQEKLVGVWEVVKSDDIPHGELAEIKDLDVKMTVEFTKDGKFIVKFTGSDKKKIRTMTAAEGTYKLDGEKFTTTQMDENDKERKDVETIKTLTETELVIVDEKGKTDVFRKAAAQTTEADELRRRVQELEEEVARLKAERASKKQSSGSPRGSGSPPPRTSGRSQE